MNKVRKKHFTLTNSIVQHNNYNNHIMYLNYILLNVILIGFIKIANSNYFVLNFE